jgi:tRNA G10  N-methylase Trm11
LNKEISTILERNFRSIEFKDKNFITKIIMNKKISKQVENEKIEKEKELYQTIKQQSQTLIEELKTKLKLKFIGEDRKIRNEIEKLDGLLKLNDDLKRLIGEIQDIESIIK